MFAAQRTVSEVVMLSLAGRRVGARSALRVSRVVGGRGGGHDDGTVAPPFHRLPRPSEPVRLTYYFQLY